MTLNRRRFLGAASASAAVLAVNGIVPGPAEEAPRARFRLGIGT